MHSRCQVWYWENYVCDYYVCYNLSLFVPFLECSHHPISISSEEEVEKFGEREGSFCTSFWWNSHQISNLDDDTD